MGPLHRYRIIVHILYTFTDNQRGGGGDSMGGRKWGPPDTTNIICNTNNFVDMPLKLLRSDEK